ncbi:MAG TPA: PAS domain S-box protein [Pyrinomonadaceae bacterium]|jgi:PAS domain S-box-containing protein|nr:PAS domain S-box protein [Pyrinomonadaceae bacterium]
MSMGLETPGTSQTDSLSFPRIFTIDGSRWRYLAAIGLTAAVYFGAGKFGLTLASVHTNVSPVWPPTGLALAAVLLFGIRVWPGVFLGALLVNLTTPIPITAAVVIAIGNTVEAVAASGVLRAFGFRKSLDRARDVFKFVSAVVICTGVSATIGNLSLVLWHSAQWHQFPLLWLTWWLGDLTGAVTVTPLILTWLAGEGHWLPRRRYFEATILILLLSASAMVTFGGKSPTQLQYYPLSRLLIPFLLWASFRLGRRGVTVAIAVVSAFAIWGTWLGNGPFISSNANESLLTLQLFLASNAVTFLALVTVVEERRLAEANRQQDQRRLEANLAVTRILAESPEVNLAFQRLLSTVGEKLKWEFGCVWLPDDEDKVLRSLATWQRSPRTSRFEQLSRERVFERGVGLPGRVWANLEPAWIRDVAKDDNFPRAAIAIEEGLRAAFAFPILFNRKFLGVIEFFSPELRQPEEPLLEMFSGIGSQLGQFMERKRAEQSLLESEQQYRSVIDALPAAVYTTDAAGRVTMFNQAAVELSGRTPEVGSDSWCVTWKLYHPDGKPMPHAECPMAIALKKGEAVRGQEAIAERPDGSRVSFVPYPTPLRDSSGQLVGAINMLVDITDRKRSEAQLRDREQRLSAFFSTAALGVAVLTPDARFEQVNDTFCRIVGYSRDELAKMDSAALTHPDDIPHMKQKLDALTEGQVPRFEIEKRYLRQDGTQIWVQNSVSATRDGAGKLLNLVMLCQDITDRKGTEDILRHMASIVETTDDAIISKDLNGTITSWNPAAERLYGYKAQEVIGKPVTILIPSERPDEEPAILERLRRGERIDHYETIRVAKDGRRLNVSLTVSPIRDASGKVIGASKIARDITQQKKAQTEIARLLGAERAARQEAEVASRTKDEFLATLSHELRTPLTAMLGWLTMLRGHKLDEKTTKHAIETIERNAKAQAQLIEDLVDISRIVGGKLSLEVGPIELYPVIDAAVEVVKPAADAKQISIKINYDPTVGPVSGDTGRLQQIIWNLMSNAVKFTPSGGSVIVDYRRQGNFAEVTVRDTGIGISEDFLPYVFERFRQAESAATRSHRGMGLGLAIVRHLVELHGGTVSVESAGENQGTTFTVHLPLAAAPKALPPSTSAHEGNGDLAKALNGLRILLVEDEPDARELIAILLQGSGATVEAVDSASGALQRLLLFIPDVLVSDIGLPRESGYDLIRQIRAMASDINKIPAIALTAFATENDRKTSLSAGFQAHLAKPVEPSDLLKTIKTLTNGQN